MLTEAGSTGFYGARVTGGCEPPDVRVLELNWFRSFSTRIDEIG